MKFASIKLAMCLKFLCMGFVVGCGSQGFILILVHLQKRNMGSIVRITVDSKLPEFKNAEIFQKLVDKSVTWDSFFRNNGVRLLHFNKTWQAAVYM